MADANQSAKPALIRRETGQVYPLTRDLVTIGRKSGNTIVLSADDLLASRYHATIIWEDGRYVLSDVGSMNGTFLNNQRIQDTQVLRDGDIIGVGETTLRVHLPLPDTQPSIQPTAPPEAATVLSAPSAPPPDPDETLVRVRQPTFLENPYVGPRTFSQEESDRFYGREVEARELLSLVIAERLVLFYAQSGAGKSSLINTRLVPQLREAGYAVLPTGRVSGELPEGIQAVDNIYIFNLLLSMDESDSDPRYFAHMGLTDFLARLSSLDGIHFFYDHQAEEEPVVDDEAYQPTPYVLLVDQFEEIITTHPSRWQDREVFFQQLAQAMEQDPYLWVVLSLREDYVASLDPYAHLLPDTLRARFYMQRMGYNAALEAVTRPAKQFGRTFAPGVAESLVDNLRQIRVQNTLSTEQVGTQLGQFVEPVQLQVVSYQLWENLAGRDTTQITQQDVQELGDVDQALAQFYEQALMEVIRGTDVTEIELRVWFEAKLITESGTKGLVYRGRTKTGGIQNSAVDILVEKYLLRSEGRGGGTWYELVHDRLIEPILQANRSWRLRQPLIQMAQTWDESGRADSTLLDGQPLREVLAGNWEGLGPLVKEFVESSRRAQQAKEEAEAAERLMQAEALAAERQLRIEEQAKANADLRRRFIWMMVFGTLALLMALGASFFGWLAQQNFQYAEEQASAALTAEAEARLAAAAEAEAREDAVAAEGTAQAESTVASEARVTAQAGATAAAVNAGEANRLLEVLRATQTAEAAEGELTSGATATYVAYLQVTLTVAAATLTAPTPTPTATATPVPPTPTPMGTFTPPATGTPTATPTQTGTPTPNREATALVADINRQLLQVTQCKIEPTGDFADLWAKYQADLGCPLYVEPAGGYFAEQPFQNGYMFWYSIPDVIYVTVGGARGEWYSFTRDETEKYNPADEGSCEADVPTGLVQPVRGFGAIWCGVPEIRRAIGFGLVEEFPGKGTLFQEFNNGVALKDSLRRRYLLFSGSKEYIRFE